MIESARTTEQIWHDTLREEGEPTRKSMSALMARMMGLNRELTPRQAEIYYLAAKHLLENESGPLWTEHNLNLQDKGFFKQIVAIVEQPEKIVN